MPALMPTETSPDVLALKTQGAPSILMALKTALKNQKKTLAANQHGLFKDNNQLCAVIDIFLEYVKALETPYPANLVSAGFNYACNPDKYTKDGARVVHRLQNEIMPVVIETIRSLTLTESAQQLMRVILTYLIAIKLGEDEKQDAVNRGQASMMNKMAYDVLQKQNPKMDFRRVCDLLIEPLITALREKLSDVQQKSVLTV